MTAAAVASRRGTQPGPRGTGPTDRRRLRCWPLPARRRGVVFHLGGAAPPSPASLPTPRPGPSHPPRRTRVEIFTTPLLAYSFACLFACLPACLPAYLYDPSNQPTLSLSSLFHFLSLSFFFSNHFFNRFHTAYPLPTKKFSRPAQNYFLTFYYYSTTTCQDQKMNLRFP